MNEDENNSNKDLELTIDNLRLDQLKSYVSEVEKILPSSIGLTKTDGDGKDAKSLSLLASVFIHTKPATPTPGGLLASKLESELRMLKKKNYLNDLKSEIVNLESKELELDSLKEDICRNVEMTKSVLEGRSDKGSPIQMERSDHTLKSYQMDLTETQDRCDVLVNKALPTMEEIDKTLSKLESLQEQHDNVCQKLEVFNSVPLDIKQAQTLLTERKEYLRSLEVQISSSSTNF